ncbi:SET domain-containing protein [Aspergillus sp. HF37]|nr:SET domain-containing protein [Aspergillus sp. HF37]
MRQQDLPIDTLPAWARLNGVSLSGVAFRRLQADDGTDKGCAVVATEDKDGHLESHSQPEALISVPFDMVLTLESVSNYAKSDRYLREVLEAVGDFGRTARGAILIFLLVQIAHSSPDLGDERPRIGVSNPWTEYVKFMPKDVPLPTFYSEEELELLRGTSLKFAVDAKNAALEREFEHLRSSTENTPWCQRYWWNGETGRLTLDDWKYVDALYRSRTLDLPGHGHSMVPCIDMANHVSEDAVKALYETDAEENAVLQLQLGRKLCADEEVTISYGDEKPASEMIFSYGFLEEGRTDAKRMVLELDIPDDDPLKLAKKAFCKDPPGIRLSSAVASAGEYPTSWDSPFAWWACVNEEDGLDFNVLQLNDGTKELKATWKGENVEDSNHLRHILQADPLWDIFQLRVVVVILERLEAQLAAHQQMERIVSDIREDEATLHAIFRPEVFTAISRLQKLETGLLEGCTEDLMKKARDTMIYFFHYAHMGS